MNIDEWKKWNAQGLFPGPKETEEEWEKRVYFCQNVKEELNQLDKSIFSFAIDTHLPENLLTKACSLTKELYGISPQWVPVFCSNYHLAPWHGGCTWIFQLCKDAPFATFLQIRANFRFKEKYWGIYQREELLAHELAHVGRMAYQEPKFEEILAYQSSKSSWRKYLGPIVQSGRETLIFLCSLVCVIFIDLVSLLMPLASDAAALSLFKALPFFLIFFAFGRLWSRHNLLRKCKKNLIQLYDSSSLATHLLYRLSDLEITHFAKFSLQESACWMKQAAIRSFRWRFLNAIYPLEINEIKVYASE
jgi:hypothetical protein